MEDMEHPHRRASDCQGVQTITGVKVCHAAENASERAADRAVEKVFAILGVNVKEPKEVEEFRKDLRFGQSLRRAADKGMVAMAAAIGTGILAALWAGIQMKFNAS